jgi:hypothetical protein
MKRFHHRRQSFAFTKTIYSGPLLATLDLHLKEILKFHKNSVAELYRPIVPRYC